jgi:hypothetical protein
VEKREILDNIATVMGGAVLVSDAVFVPQFFGRKPCSLAPLLPFAPLALCSQERDY